MELPRSPKSRLWPDDKQEFCEMPAFQEPSIDTLDGGDIFNGGFTVSFGDAQDITQDITHVRVSPGRPRH